MITNFTINICFLFLGFIRETNKSDALCITEIDCPQQIPTTIATGTYCTDPLREFKTCGPTCPLSCQPQREKCEASESCVKGCFCKIPYILENASDPIHSAYEHIFLFITKKNKNKTIFN